MDETLAGIPATAAWASTAAQLRVEWRLRVQNEELVEEISAAALEIIDNRIVRTPNLHMLSLRAWCAYRAGSPHATLGSISRVARRIIDTGEQLGAGERGSLETNLKALLPVVDAISARGQVDAGRVEAVRSILADAINTL
jgi:hypothetical protein